MLQLNPFIHVYLVYQITVTTFNRFFLIMGSQKFKSQEIFYSIFVLCGIILLYGESALSTPLTEDTNEYPLKLQPELDNFDISKYIQNERLMKLQFKCLIFDGPCDIVGRWAKPRAKAALLGECLKCTKTQEGWLRDWYKILVDKFPDMYRAAVAKYIENEGVEIGEEEKKKIEDAFSDDKVSTAAGDISKIIPTITNGKSNETETTATTPNSSSKEKEET